MEKNENTSAQLKRLQYASQLAECNTSENSTIQNNYHNLISSNSTQIIYQLGGLHNVLNLCLTHPNSSDFISDKQLNSLQKTVNIAQIKSISNIGNDPSNEAPATRVDTTEMDPHHDGIIARNVTSTKTVHLDHELEHDDDDHEDEHKMNINKANTIGATLQSSSNNYNYNNNNGDGNVVGKNNPSLIVASNKDSEIIGVNTIKEYHSKTVLITVNATNNIYFNYIFADVGQKYRGSYWFYSVLLNKWYPIGMLSIMALFGLIAEIVVIAGNNGNNESKADYNTVFILRTFMYLIVMGTWISYIFAANIKIMFLIFETFDFWFKIFYVLLNNIASYQLLIHNNSQQNASDFVFYLYLIILVTSGWPVFFTAFIYDAIMMPNKTVKYIFVILITLLMCYFVIYIYFYFEDVFWNPFKSYNIKETKISLKSMFISSYVNIILFQLKPVLSPIVTRLKRKLKRWRKQLRSGNKNVSSNGNSDGDSSSENIQNGNGKQHEQCGLIYKRPKLEWQNKSLIKYRRSISVLDVAMPVGKDENNAINAQGDTGNGANNFGLEIQAKHPDKLQMMSLSFDNSQTMETPTSGATR